MEEKSASQCGCSPQLHETETNHRSRVITVQFLELDMTHIGASSCSACMSVEDQLHQMVTELQPIFEKVDTAIKIEKKLVTSLEQAKTLQFKASPSIRIAEIEIIPTKGDILGLGERYWEWNGTFYSSPPTALVVDALLRAYANNGIVPDKTPTSYEVPYYLQEYFVNPSVKTQSGNCGCS